MSCFAIRRPFADWVRLCIHCAELGSGITRAAENDDAALLDSSAE